MALSGPSSLVFFFGLFSFLLPSRSPLTKSHSRWNDSFTSNYPIKHSLHSSVSCWVPHHISKCMSADKNGLNINVNVWLLSLALMDRGKNKHREGAGVGVLNLIYNLLRSLRCQKKNLFIYLSYSVHPPCFIFRNHYHVDSEDWYSNCSLIPLVSWSIISCLEVPQECTAIEHMLMQWLAKKDPNAGNTQQKDKKCNYKPRRRTQQRIQVRNMSSQ